MNSEHCTPLYTVYGSATWPCYGPGVSFILKERSHKPPADSSSSVMASWMHGIGFCDAYPAILYPENLIPGAFNYVLESDGRECVKLEEQLITDSGVENMTKRPF
ncbi:hypothetical protein [Mesorhizobium sp. M1027]|uniref:hypothetical protein n=1 Tax=Mesorhizobium sp. M1027 TaxID=2957050 RepID=UPI00333D133E